MTAESVSFDSESDNPGDFIKFSKTLIFEEKFADFLPNFGYLGKYEYVCNYQKSSTTSENQFTVK